MVLEYIISPRLLEKRPIVSLLIGLIYSVIGILSAAFVFPKTLGAMSVGLVSLLLAPTLANLISVEESQAEHVKRNIFKSYYHNHRDIFEVFIFLFMGVFLGYALIILFLPQETILEAFAPQLHVAGIAGQAISNQTNSFLIITLNNILILSVCFVLSFFYGMGAIFFITWNASVWAAIFAYNVKINAGVSNPIIGFLLLMLPILPHMLTEILSYLFGIFSGGILSKSINKEFLKGDYLLTDKKFYIKDFRIFKEAIVFYVMGIVLVVIGSAIEVYLFPIMAQYI